MVRILRFTALGALFLAGCTPEHYGFPDMRKAFSDIEQCESQASTTTGLYKAGTSEGRTWLEIKNDCLRKRME